MKIEPRLDILPEAQKEIWLYLADVPKNFVLYGGTAVALRYGHRASVDFDFFTSKQGIDLQATGKTMPFVSKFPHDIKKRSENHVDFIFEVNKEIVKLTLLNNKDIIAGSIYHPDIVESNKIKIASPIDLMACKILALHNRSEAKDYADVAAMIKHGISLQKGFEAAQAISKLSRLGSGQLMLDRLQADFCSKSVEKIISSSEDICLTKMSNEYAEILRQSAKSLDINKILNTRTKAYACIERQPDNDRGR